METLGHHCGVAGIWSPNPLDLPERLFYMLFALQHRGQESCGIAWDEGGRIRSRKELGMVAPGLGGLLGSGARSTCGVGHVRYSTAGGGGLPNAQPLVAETNKGELALAHNGNLSNGGRLREELRAAGSIFQGSADSELFLHLVSRSREAGREAWLREALEAAEGAFSLAVMHEGALIAARDPLGFRPLYLGLQGAVRYLASETCALAALGPMDWREIEPGEVCLVDGSGERSFFLRRPARALVSPGPIGGRAEAAGASGTGAAAPEPDRGGAAGTAAERSRAAPAAEAGLAARRRCVFELIYFARPDSEVFGESVHAFRLALGETLAERDLEAAAEARAAGRPAVEPDIVVPVPDSGNIAAIGYARRAGLPFDFGLARSHYAGRSFILPTKEKRELAARLKLHAVAPVVAGKRVLLIDDSLVRGTTSRIIVGLLREAGAREVHLRLAAPELRWPCRYGIDIPDREDLISNRLDPEGIAREVGADSVAFLPVGSLLRAAAAGAPEGGRGPRGAAAAPGADGSPRCAVDPASRGYCAACFDGRDPFPAEAGPGGAAEREGRLPAAAGARGAETS